MITCEPSQLSRNVLTGLPCFIGKKNAKFYVKMQSC